MTAAWYQANKEEKRAYSRARYHATKEKTKAHRSAYSRAYNLSLKLEVFGHYGGICQCCGEYKHQFLSIDHINGRGTEQRRELGLNGVKMYRWLKKANFPVGYQVLCHNCNFAKGIFGLCPHQSEEAAYGSC